MLRRAEPWTNRLRRIVTMEGVREMYAVCRPIWYQPGFVTGYDVEPDEGDVAEAVRMLAAGEVVQVGSQLFAERIRRAAPLVVDVTWHGDLWELEAR